MEQLKHACSDYLQTSLMPAVAALLNDRSGLPEVELVMDPTDNDRQTILVRYPATVNHASAAYVNSVVKIELGARSGNEPVMEGSAAAMASEVFPEASWARSVFVRALDPVRTFWEKLFLLHEENTRPEGRADKGRLSRHLYDLIRLQAAGIGNRAVQTSGLYERVLANRKALFSYSWIDFSTMKPGSLRLVPPPEKVKMFRQDYLLFSRDMIYGRIPTFDELLAGLRQIETVINSDNA